MAAPPSQIPRHLAHISDRREGHPLVVVTLSLPRSVLQTHSVPGQYVSIAAGGEEGYFVLASPIGADAWKLLVKAGGTAADTLLAAPLGTTVSTSAALGDGFPCDDARGRPLFVTLAGTGIAAAPPIAARRIAEGDAARTHMFLGLRHAADSPCTEDVTAWRAAGLRVTLCVSREEPSQPGTERGYVQDVARVHLARESAALLFAVGPEPMLQALRALAKSLGIKESDVRTNY